MASPFAYLAHRAVLSLTGPDTLTLLERLVTHATENWSPGTTRYGALLTPQGKVIADYLALRAEDGVLLDVAKDYAADLAKRLKMFRLRSRVEIEILEDVFVVAGLEAAASGVRPISGAQHVYVDPRYPVGRLRGLATKESWAAWYGYHPAEWSQPVDAYHRDRIRSMVPEQGFDFGSADVFPADINMDILGGVALNKGCFVGQEVVSRMHRRGRIRKRTLCVEAPANIVLEPDTEIIAPLSIGTLSSAEGSHALARVRVDRMLKAEQAGEMFKVHETPVMIAKPDWLGAELDAMEQS
ncbi:MAG: CAF17-like 4Fe-4S cluster assembly/insertion protein YgfZ [Henriciella sp.]